MKVYIPNTSKQSIGGGWTFLRNIKKALGDKISFVGNWQECDVVLITGATMTQRQEILDAKEAGKKIVFRVDNIPKDSRNRGTAFSRMLDFAKLSDHIIFQSEWAKDYAGWWFGDNGVDISIKSSIVYNGVDTEFFFNDGRTDRNPKRYLVVQYNRDENKRVPESFYLFHQAFRQDKAVELWVVGQFSPELVSYNFDFFAGENVSYHGIIDDPAQLGEIMRSCQYLLFPAFADASPNTVMEAMACGCEVVGVNDIGGTKELLNLKGRTIQDMGNEYLELFTQLTNK